SQQLDNRQGQISSAQDLSIHDQKQQSLSIDNSDNGKILAGNDLNIQSKQLNNPGSIGAGRHATIQLHNDFNVDADIKTGGRLHLSSQGSIKNNHTLSGGDSVILNAANIDNQASGIIQSKNHTELQAQNNLINRGLINSNGTTLVQSGHSINNIGSGRIYGDHVAIGTHNLINQEETIGSDSKAAVIAARQRLDIGATHIINQEHALLSSEGDIAIGGALNEQHQATGMADSLINSSARIEAQRDGNIAVKELHNLNNHFTLEEYLANKERIQQYKYPGRTEKWTEGVDGHFAFNDSRAKFTFNDGSTAVVYNKKMRQVKWWDFTRKTYKQRVKESDPGQIIIGGNLNIAGSHWENNNSQILVGGNLIGTDNLQLDNIETKGQQRVEDKGKVGYIQYERGGKWHTGPYHAYKGDGGKYSDTTTTTIDLDQPVSLIQQHTAIGSNQGKASTANPTGHEIGNIDSNNQSSASNHNIAQQQQHIQTLTDINTRLPNSSLYHTNPNNNGYLVETDPAFTNKHKWLGSDYMLSALGQDPNKMQKRLGDGYYEQRLINEQIANLTGFRHLEGYQNDEEQYKALMNAGITAAREMSLVPGIALSAEQIARLTSDIVWLVNQTVTLADGSQQTVLVPQIYLMVRDGDINSAGALISANNISLHTNQDLNNQGSIAGRKIVDLGAQNISNSGLISGNKIALNASNNIDFNGGAAQARDLLSLKANHISINTTTATHGDQRNGATVIDRVAGLYVTGNKDSILTVDGKQGIDINGAQIINTAVNGQTQLRSSEGSVNLNTVQIADHETDGKLSDRNHMSLHHSAEVGSQILTQGDISIGAGKQINIRQSEIDSLNGSVNLYGKESVNISEGRKTADLDESFYHKSSNIVSSHSNLDKYQAHHNEAVASNITGAKINIRSDQDINIRGSNIISDNGTLLHAGKDINISAADNHYTDHQYHKETKSGLMGSGGIGVTIGSQKESDDTTSQSLIHSGSSIGSLSGNTNIIAGNHYSQTGSSVSSPRGDINIIAKQIDISAAEDQHQRDNIHTFEKSGLTVAVNVPVINAIQAADTAIKRVGKSKNDRVNAMAAYNAGADINQAKQALTDIGKDPKNPANISVSITVGQQKSRSESHSVDNIASASNIHAGGQINLLATGAGQDSNINIIGSDISGNQGTHLQADNQINLLAAEQSHSERSKNKSSGWNAGVAISYGSDGMALGVTAGANRGKGHANSDETSYRNSHIGSLSGNTSLISGGATNIKGAQVTGKGVSIDAAELNIESLQDSAKYNSKQQNIGGQITVGYGASASANYSKSKIKADYAGVTEQSGIIAGDNGYQIKVTGNTDLKGAIITSTEAAEAAGKNQLTTGSLTSSDIKNHSDYKGSSIGIGASGSVSGSSLGQSQPSKNNSIKLANQGGTGASNTVGYGSDSGHDSSTTHSGINTHNIIITDETAQQQKSGKSAAETIAGIHTDTTSDNYADKAGYLSNNFDKNKVQQELDLQREVSQEFSANIQATSAFINSKKDKLKEELKQENLSPEQRAQYEKELAQWNTGGLILNAIGAGLSAPTNSIGGILAATASPVLSHQIGQYFKVLAHKNQITGGKDELTAGQEAAHILAHTILGAAVAAAGGNDALAGGLAAAGAEATAPILSQWLYGKNPADLTADEKATVSAIAGLTGAATGVTVGGSMADVAQGDQAGHIAVDNNTEFGDKIREYINDTKRYWHTEKEAKDNLDVIRNVAVNLIGDGLDSVVGLADYGIDSLNAIVYCTGVTPDLCNQMQATLNPKNKAVLNSIKAAFDTRTYIQFYELLDKAAHGDLQAREAAGELLAAVLIAKKVNLNVGKVSKAGIKVTEKAVAKVANAAKKEVIEAGKSIGKGASIIDKGKIGVPVTKAKNPLSPVQQYDAYGNEIVYRTMSEKQYEKFRETGMMPATTETSVSPVLGYSSQYNGITVKITVKSGTFAELEKIGIAANEPAAKQFPNMSNRTGKWMQTNTRFKVEGGQMTTQLGQGKGIEIFNHNIVDFERVR
ncbi:hemagglutinin repeat-containing protein, partial [Snodgrassella communis]|uniref:hemagglutinin repeat-containing protein n=1 Tax=Snodgrassella communis TaxID=2946699 RepID=UPI001EF50478